VLDAEEYLALAVHASSVKDHHTCLTYLDEVLRQQPRNASALFLRAVQHAELGLTARALRDLEAALEINPGLEIARFRLGMLLLIGAGRRAEAKEHLAKLAGIRDVALRFYAEGLIALADNDLACAQTKIEAGLAAPSSNPGLAAMLSQLLGTYRQISS
jgi:tetratricopeptide (TPR) repeat protein